MDLIKIHLAIFIFCLIAFMYHAHFVDKEGINKNSSALIAAIILFLGIEIILNTFIYLWVIPIYNIVKGAVL